MLTLWEFKIFALRLTLDTRWNWRTCDMCLICAWIWFLLIFWLKKAMATILEMVNEDSIKDHWCLLDGRFVVHFTRHK